MSEHIPFTPVARTKSIPAATISEPSVLKFLTCYTVAGILLHGNLKYTFPFMLLTLFFFTEQGTWEIQQSGNNSTHTHTVIIVSHYTLFNRILLTILYKSKTILH